MDNIANYVQREEVEDPPEPVKTAMALLNERNPLHKLEERLDSVHMITHNNWGIYFTTNEYWEFEIPFMKEMNEEESSVSEYDPSYEPLVYLPNHEHSENMAYSAEVEHDIEEDVLKKEDEPEGELTEDNSEDILLTDFKLALEIESFIKDLVEKKAKDEESISGRLFKDIIPPIREG